MNKELDIGTDRSRDSSAFPDVDDIRDRSSPGDTEGPDSDGSLKYKAI